MAASKHARIAENDSDDTEPDTPRPNNRQGSKKRISDIHGLDPDASFNSDSGRAPLRAVSINDDAAEKRRRRKSNKPAVIESAEPGPSSGDRMDTGEGSRTALAKQKQQQQLNSVHPPPVINVPLDVMNSNFEEWMKMATDNVCARRQLGLLAYSLLENKRSELMEFRPDRLFPRHVPPPK